MKRNLMMAAAFGAGCAVFLFGAALMAGTTVPDVIEMKNPAYDEHKKPIVHFNHKAHSEKFGGKYPEIFENGCGECHHDEDGEPLTDLEMGDEVNSCIECHDKPGEMPRTEKRKLRKEGLSREERQEREREYHAEAIHDNCRSCHREARKQADTRKPPITCSKCHVKDKS
jgi:hypothetical protein